MSLINIDQPTARLAVTTSTGRVAYNAQATGTTSLVLYNAGGSDVFAVSGGSTIEAAFPSAGNSAAGSVIPAGAIVSLAVNANDTHIAAITESGTATLYIQRGNGE